MTPITAPDVVVRAWQAEATRARAAAHRATDPLIVESLTRDAPREVAELVTYMSVALSHAADLFRASVANATPSGEPCPIPDPGGAAYPCKCEPEGRAGCATIVADLAVAVDDGCEGGVR